MPQACASFQHSVSMQRSEAAVRAPAAGALAAGTDAPAGSTVVVPQGVGGGDRSLPAERLRRHMIHVAVRQHALRRTRTHTGQ